MSTLTEFIKRITGNGQAATTPRPSRPSFVARIMLHYVPEGYPKLHEAMSSIGFEQSITGTKDSGGNIRSKLPGGMYYYNSGSSKNLMQNHSLGSIYTLVKKVVVDVINSEGEEATKANTPPTIIVIESSCVRWEGLDDAE
jgi:hypothetical protein